ncbi:MAG TPA: protease HtpX [Candidatus Aphodousia gallistercoris]|nr:protease HtpX [Candidatus Aphodousia gallistercoris]
MFKRIGLFVLTNLAILVMLSIILNLVSWFFGVNFGQIAGSNQNYATLLIFAAVIGFTGSLISLFMSKTMAKTSMGLQMIDVDNPRNGVERWLVETVAKLAKIKGVAMPEVGIYHGEPNAFATGPSRNNSLVAVSDGLLASMNREEVEAVLGHEMSHVANGDMVTMTLMQGVINTFVVFLSRVIGNIVDRGILRNESDAPGAGYYITSFVLDMVLGLLGSMLVMAFSRYREYRADAGAAEALGSPVPMINALARLGGQPTSELPGAVKGFGINGGIGSLFASHPSIEQRIKALRELQQR